MRLTLRRRNMTASSFSGSGPPGSRWLRRPRIMSSLDGLPCTGISSIQRSLTSFALEKNRWPPMSIRQSPQTAVLDIPPMNADSSSTTTRHSLDLRRSSWAAVRPAGPAPIMIAVFTCYRLLPKRSQERIAANCGHFKRMTCAHKMHIAVVMPARITKNMTD